MTPHFENPKKLTVLASILLDNVSIYSAIALLCSVSGASLSIKIISIL